MEKMMEKGNKEIIMWPNYFLIIHSSFRMTINLLPYYQELVPKFF